MEIFWYGLSCFRLNERKMASVVTDPYDASALGLSPLKVRADVVTVSMDAPDRSFTKGVGSVQRHITGPGEYEVGSVFIIGAPMVNAKKLKKDPDGVLRNVVYLFDYEGMTVLHLGGLDHVPGQSAVEKLGAVDVVLVPVGGGAVLDSARAAEVVSLLEPSVVVPMHYRTPDLNLDLAPVDKFLKEMGVTNPQEEESLRVSRTTLPEQTEVVLLTNRQAAKTS